jgi:hypothetical protein
MRFLTAALFSALLSAPAFAADLGMYRPGTPYNSAVAGGADVCDSQCAGDAQCRGWNYVKPNPRAAGICEFLSSVSAPIASQISISGESQTVAPFSSRVMPGSTNTVRVGTTVTPRTNTVKVGQSPSGRRVVRQTPTQRITPNQTSTRPIEDMSLTAQQNRYRQAQGQLAPSQQPTPAQQNRPMFRPILDAPAPPQAYAPNRPNIAQPRRAVTQRRATGPRNAAAQGGPMRQQQMLQMGQRIDPRQQSSRPPIGQPIAAPQNMQRPPLAQRPTQARVTSPSQRVAQLTAQTRAQGQAPMRGQSIPPQVKSTQTGSTQGPAALSPDQARRSLFGRLNDDVKAPESTAQDMPIVTSVPTQPVTQEPLGSLYGDSLAGGR